MPKTTNRGANRLDLFPNFYKVLLTTPFADTVYAPEWVTGYSIKDGYAFILHKIIYQFTVTTLNALNAMGDYIICGMGTRSDLTITDFIWGINSSIMDGRQIGLRMTTAVGEQYPQTRYESDFTNEPGGGRIVAPKPLYIYMGSSGLGAVFSMGIQIIYTMVKLDQNTYRELYESMNPNA